MDTKENSLRVFMLPWLAHGHITPFILLAKKLIDKNFFIYFCSTPINLPSINKKFTDEKYSLSLQLVELHLPSSPELPPHYHTTYGLPPHLMPALLKAYQSSKHHLSNTLTNLSPDVIIYDVSQSWVGSVSESLNILHIPFHTSSSVVCSYQGHFFSGSGTEYPFPAIYLTEREMVAFRRVIESFPKNNTESESPKALSFEIVLVNSFEEIEGKYIDHWSTSLKKRVIPVGPLFEEYADDDIQYDDMQIMEWLNKKESSSTVFVAFGSEYFLGKEEMEEIAHGLELSNVNFIWVIRFPAGEEIKLEEALPLGFQERVKGRGMIVEGWAPQRKILSHSSVGGFLSHCGWNSVIESMRFRVPIIAMPIQLDQPYNARLMVEVGVAMEVARERNGGLEREEVAKGLRKVVVENSGEDLRRKVRGISEKMREIGEKNIDLVAEEILKMSQK